jgi:DnaJ-class molecular chaperone
MTAPRASRQADCRVCGGDGYWSSAESGSPEASTCPACQGTGRDTGRPLGRRPGQITEWLPCAVCGATTRHDDGICIRDARHPRFLFARAVLGLTHEDRS